MKCQIFEKGFETEKGKLLGDAELVDESGGEIKPHPVHTFGGTLASASLPGKKCFYIKTNVPLTEFIRYHIEFENGSKYTVQPQTDSEDDSQPVELVQVADDI